MDVLSSAVFRKQYARLVKPTKVTVNGHVIGVWTPGGMLGYDDLPGVIEREMQRGDERFNTRPFTPVPKAGRR